MTSDEKHFVRKKKSSLNGSFSPPSKFCYTTAHSPQFEDQYGIEIPTAPKPNPVTQSDAKTICHFIQALNASYPDYDFSDSVASDFAQESDVATVRVYIDDLLGKSLKVIFLIITSLLSTLFDKCIANNSNFETFETLSAAEF